MTSTASSLTSLVDDLADIVGAAHVSVDLDDRRRASADWAKMSPILEPQLPLGLADVVAQPGSADEIGAVVAAAVRRRVPITVRGKGTGNYGQAIPFRGGLVLDTLRANAIVEFGEDAEGTFVTAEAGATLAQLETAALERGQQIWMFSSTVNSSVAGFLSGGSGGTGTIRRGWIGDGFAAALDVAIADGGAELHHVEGAAVLPYLHAYGTSGVIARATVRTEPAQDWRAMYASFERFEDALALIRVLGNLDPLPRLVSADTPTVVNALPPNAGHPRGRASLRAIVDAPALAPATAIVEAAGGRVEAVREGMRACQKLSLLSYNHPTWHLQKAHPGKYFHLEVGGDALVDRYAEVDGVFPGSQLHIEMGHRRPTGMLNGYFQSPEQVQAGIAALEALGVGVHSPHQWYVDRNVDLVKATAAKNDPHGLLNPGKLPA
jgi:FAD/FMN-containing dehydrogenase